VRNGNVTLKSECGRVIPNILLLDNIGGKGSGGKHNGDGGNEANGGKRATGS